MSISAINTNVPSSFFGQTPKANSPSGAATTSLFSDTAPQGVTTQQPPAASLSAAPPTKGESVEQQFLDYMKKSPGQRMIDAWLKAHHLTQEQLNALPPAQRDAVLKQMSQDIKNEIDQKTAIASNGGTDITV